MTEQTPSDVIATQIRHLRRRAGLTRAQLAEACASHGAPELTFGALTNIETGRRDPQTGRRRRAVTVDELLALANALEVTPAALVFPDDALRAATLEPHGDMIRRLTEEAVTVYKSELAAFAEQLADEVAQKRMGHVGTQVRAQIAAELRAEGERERERLRGMYNLPADQDPCHLSEALHNAITAWEFAAKFVEGPAKEGPRIIIRNGPALFPADAPERAEDTRRPW